MAEKEFCLCTQPWIYVKDKEGRMKKVSLKEALIDSHMYAGLAGETETQNAAILRLLLAVVYTVVYRSDEEGMAYPVTDAAEAMRRWKAIWDCRHLPEVPIREYLEMWKDRFWLFHETTPFFQTPGVTGTVNPAKKMNGALVESSNKIQMFSMCAGENKEYLSYDEAARWIVYVQSYGDTAAKKPSPKLCWTGGLGLVYANGSTLFETLMLNLVMTNGETGIWDEPKPSWEQNITKEKLREIPLPYNQPELLTMQCRRIWLEREEGKVVRYVEAAGDYTQKESAFPEQMTYWRILEDKKKGNEILPAPHKKERQMWRDFSGLIGMDVNRKTAYLPGVVQWISRLVSGRIIAPDRQAVFRTVGIEYGSMCCGVADEFSDSLCFNLSVLQEIQNKGDAAWLIPRINEQIVYCEQMAVAAGTLAFRLDKASGGGDGTAAKAQSRAAERTFAELDLPFRQWLLDITSAETRQDQMQLIEQWRYESEKIVRAIGAELAESCNTTAITGRAVVEKKSGKGGKEKVCHYSSPGAFNLFLGRLKKIKAGDQSKESGEQKKEAGVNEETGGEQNEPVKS